MGVLLFFNAGIRIALLDKWLERNGPWATYRKLAECLYEAGAIETLQVLCEELGGNFAAMNAPPPNPPPLNPPQTSPQSSTSNLRCMYIYSITNLASYTLPLSFQALVHFLRRLKGTWFS